MSVRDFCILALFITLIFTGIFIVLYRIENGIKNLSMLQEVNECYVVDELNVIICKKENNND